jgi:effector-binding domain-containing protein
MKWLTSIVFFALLAVGGFFAGGYFGLSQKIEIVRSKEIDRPASILYPLISNLRTFNEFSPWFDRDPKADFVFTGPREGAGQSASWQSSVQSVGSGMQEIKAAQLNKSVETLLKVNGKRAKSVWTLGPGRSGSGAKVTWAITLDCGADIMAVPCRYWNFIDRVGFERDMDFGLDHLQKVASGLPALEIASLKPEFVTVQEQDFAYLEPDTTRDDSSIDSALRDSFTMVAGFIKTNNLAAAGPPMAVQTKTDNDKMSFRAGIPYSGPTPATQIAVKTGKTPSGLALKVIAAGSREDLKPVYARIEAYMAAHRLEAAAGSWEVYIDDPASIDPARRTAIYYPITKDSFAPPRVGEEDDDTVVTTSAAP